MVFGIICIFIAVLCGFAFYFFKQQKRNEWVSTDDFDKWKKKLTPASTTEEINNFMIFLQEYKGGFIRRKSGKIIRQEFLNKEKGDLKGIFYNIVFPSSNLDIRLKEDFRKLLVSIGVDGLDKRPEYESRDSRLKNNKSDIDEYERKKVGNKGEKIVRDFLSGLNTEEYSVINGPVLRYGDTKKEFDHIVIGPTGIFCVETKAFGMSDGNLRRGNLVIEEGDKWFVYNEKHRREVKSPSLQLMEQKDLLNSILYDFIVDVRPILVLSNSELTIDLKVNLPYKIIKADDLENCIRTNKDRILANDCIFILQTIDNARVN